MSSREEYRYAKQNLAYQATEFITTIRECLTDFDEEGSISISPERAETLIKDFRDLETSYAQYQDAETALIEENEKAAKELGETK